MSEEKKGFNWKYLIPVYGFYLIIKSDDEKKGKSFAFNIIITLILIGMLSGQDNKNATAPVKSDSPAETQNTEPQYKVGVPYKTDKFEITITKVAQKTKVGGQFFQSKPAAGGVFIAVQYKYKNITDKPVGGFSFPSIKLIDAKGTKFDYDSGASSSFATEIKLDRKILSNLNPGITVNAGHVFEISTDSWKEKGWKLLVDSDTDVEMPVN